MGQCASKEPQRPRFDKKPSNHDWAAADLSRGNDDDEGSMRGKRKSRGKVLKSDTIATFIPSAVKEFAQHCAAENIPWESPMIQRFTYKENKQAVALFADVSGFTAMTEALAKRGPAIGAQKLAESLNHYLSVLVKSVNSAGGDIFKFAGDALIALWTVEGDFKKAKSGKMRPDRQSLGTRLQDTVHRVVDCCCRMQRELNGDTQFIRQKQIERVLIEQAAKGRKLRKEDVEADTKKGQQLREELGIFELPRLGMLNENEKEQKQGEPYEGILMTAPDDPDPITLLVKFGVGVGDATIIHVGGVNFLDGQPRMEYLPIGPALNQAFLCEGDATGGQTIISPEVYNELQKVNQRLTPDEMANADDNDALKMLSVSCGSEGNHYIYDIRQCRKKKARNIKIGMEAEELIKSFIPKALMPHLRIGQQLWAGELRYLTVMFLSLGVDLTIENVKDENLHRVNDVLRVVQDSIYAYEGSLNKFLSDDKGSTVMILFGLAPVAHEDDPTRAVLAAVKMNEALAAMEEPCHCAVGIATGVVFCGPVGAAGSRREYTVLGDRANLAARLMAHGKYNWNKKAKTADELYKETVPREEVQWKDTEHELPDVGPDLEKFVVEEDRERAQQSQLPVHLSPWSRSAVQTSSKKGVLEMKDDGTVVLGGPNITVDDDIYQAVHKRCDRIRFTDLKKIHVKGKSDEIHIWTVDRLEKERSADAPQSPAFGATQRSADGEDIKRASTLNLHDDSKDWKKTKELLTACDSSLVLIENQMGMAGRDRLLRDIAAAPELQGMKKFWVKGDPYDERDRINVWPSVLDSLGRAGLLEDLEEEKEPTPGGIVQAVAHAAKDGKICLALEDLHCLSNDDWAVANEIMCKAVAGELANVVVLASSKPIQMSVYTSFTIGDERKDEYEKLHEIVDQAANGILFPREAWGRERTEKYVLDRLQEDGHREVQQLGKHSLDTICERTGGRPGFIEEFFEDLQRNDSSDDEKAEPMLVVKGNTAEFNDRIVTFLEAVSTKALDVTNDVAFAIPPIIESTCFAALDTLTPEKGLVLKVAASLCIGYGNGVVRFGRRTLEGAHPVEQYKPSINRSLKELEDNGFLIQVAKGDQKGPDTGFRWEKKFTPTRPLLSFYEARHQLDWQGKLVVKDGRLKSKKQRKGVEYTFFLCKDGVMYWFQDGQQTREDAEHWAQGNCNMVDVESDGITILEKKRNIELATKTGTIVLSSRKGKADMVAELGNALIAEHQKTLKTRQDKSEDTNDFADAQIRAAFNAVDEDGDGTLDKQEFAQALQNMEITLDKQVLDTTYKSLDADGDGAVTLKEFKAWVRDPQLANGRHDLAKKLVNSQKEGPFYEFAFGFMRDVCYKTMLFKQRARIHQKAARYFEDKQKEIWNLFRSLEGMDVLQQISIRQRALAKTCATYGGSESNGEFVKSAKQIAAGKAPDPSGRQVVG